MHVPWCKRGEAGKRGEAVEKRGGGGGGLLESIVWEAKIGGVLYIQVDLEITSRVILVVCTT